MSAKKPNAERCERLLSTPPHDEQPLRCTLPFSHDPPHVYDPERPDTPPVTQGVERVPPDVRRRNQEAPPEVLPCD